MPDYFLEPWQISQFGNRVEQLLQDRGAKLREFVTFDSDYTGKGAAPVNQYGETAGQFVTERLGPTPNNAVESDRRWLYPRDWDWGHAIDDFDRLRSGIAPDGPITQAGVNAARRAEDDIILSALYADAKTGETGATTTTFDSNQVVDVSEGGANSGLNHDKLRAAIEMLGENDVDLEVEAPIMAITWTEWNDLFGFNTTTSADFTMGADGRPINSGRLPRLYNITFVPFAERRLRANDYYSSNALSLPLWLRSGMHLGIWQDRTATVLSRPDLKGVMQPYIKQTMGATRLQEKKVIKVNVYRAA